jgi:folate-binding protein YgfZ
MLSAQGRYLADLFVYPLLNQCFLLEVNRNAKDRVLESLKKYKMRSKIEITDLADLYISIYSTQAIESICYKDPRYEKLKYKSLVLQEKNNLQQIGEETDDLYKLDKYQYTIPEGEIDLKSDKSFPQEYGLDILNGISYTKGCYVGQEVVSRTKHQGVIRKKAYFVQSDIDFNDENLKDKITCDEKEIGFITSYNKAQAIALIRQDSAEDFQNAQINERKLQIKPAIWYPLNY